MAKPKIILLTAEALGSVEILTKILMEKAGDAAIEIIEFSNDYNSLSEDLNAAKKSLEEKESSFQESLKQLEEANQKLEDAKQQLDVYSKTIAELSQDRNDEEDFKKVTSAQVKSVPNHKDKVFTLDEVEYGFNYPKTTLNREAVTVDDVLASEELQRKLVGMKSGMVFAK